MTEDLDDYDPLFDGGGASFMLAGPGAVARDGGGILEVDDTRAYLLTGGRTGGGRADVSMETIVVMSPTAGPTPDGQPELAAIVRQCCEPLAVAEIAALLSLALGVVQVLVGDLVADGYLIPSESMTSMHEDIPFLERLIERVSAL